MLVGCVSFDCHQGSPFSHIGDACCYLVCVLSFRHHSLSLHIRPLLFRQQHSLSLLRRSLARSVCLDVPASLSHSPLPAARTLRIALGSRPAGRACTTAKGVRADIDRTVVRAVATAVTSPPILHLGRARLVESLYQGTVEIN
jgi:hypothetical protein